MTTAVSLDRSLQHLIDLRLDSLERILMDSGVSRAERMEIVQAVEDQIFEMLEQRSGEATRESILELLRSLDPPEAYHNEDARFELLERVPRRSRGSATTDRLLSEGPRFSDAPPRTPGLAIAAMILGIVSLPLMIIWPLGLPLAIAGFVCGITALPMIAKSQGRLCGNWMAIVALVAFGLYFVGAVCLLYFAS